METQKQQEVCGRYDCFVDVDGLFVCVPFQLIEKHGYEAEHHLFRCLFSFIDFTGDGKNNGKDFLQVSGFGFLLRKRN